MTFVHTHRVRYHETDAQSFLFNSRYLEIADVAMAEFFRHLGWTYAELNAQGVDPSVVSASLTFRSPAHFEDLIEFHVVCLRVGRSSFDLLHSVSRGQQELASIAITYVNVDAASKRSRPLPTAVVEALSIQRSPT